MKGLFEIRIGEALKTLRLRGTTRGLLRGFLLNEKPGQPARAFGLLNSLRNHAAGVKIFDALALIGSAVSEAIFLVSSASSLACAVRASNCFLL